jgi:dipeptidyl aminopeptidase/acylaminoacyl peptidase
VTDLIGQSASLPATATEPGATEPGATEPGATEPGARPAGTRPSTTAATTGPATPFHDLDTYLGLPRLGGLRLSPDGTRLVTAVSTLDPERNRYVTALWEVDPSGDRPARRLTRSAKGEGGAAFLPDGSLLFVSARPDPETKVQDDAPAALWLLPAGGGEAAVVSSRPGGVGGVVAAAGCRRVVVGSATMPGAVTAADDQARRTARKDRKVTAILHESYPIRFWDHDLGPDEQRLLVADLSDEPAEAGSPPVPRDATRSDDSQTGDVSQTGDELPGRVALRDLTPTPGRALDEAQYDLSPDGRTLITTWTVPEGGGGRRPTLVAIDTGTGRRRTLLTDPEIEYYRPRFSPDGLRVAVLVEQRSTAAEPIHDSLAVLDLADGALRPVAPGWDAWPLAARWSPDGTALLVTADEVGASPVFRIGFGEQPDADTVTRLTGDRGCYTDLQVSPDGRSVYALRAAVDAAAAPVRLDAAVADQQPTPLRGPAPDLPLPGRLTEVTTTAADGTPLRAWLALPEGAGPQAPAPLLLWIHGGPLHSWNSWSWRWNPWLLVARGYAVLLPDPALSTGYGQDFIRRGWGRWGAEPFTDLMSVTDAAVARDDLDAGRTAAMGGSFGGYMANWVAGHTDRFRGIVTHASLWALDQFGPTTDGYDYWRREMTAQMALDNSPHLSVREIRTPLLVVHGDRDYRVPIGEAVRLWAELAEHHADDEGRMPHKFLHFPDEHHWVLGPEHAKVWYATVFAFLDHTVHGRDWQVPEILR